MDKGRGGGDNMGHDRTGVHQFTLSHTGPKLKLVQIQKKGKAKDTLLVIFRLTRKKRSVLPYHKRP